MSLQILSIGTLHDNGACDNAQGWRQTTPLIVWHIYIHWLQYQATISIAYTHTYTPQYVYTSNYTRIWYKLIVFSIAAVVIQHISAFRCWEEQQWSSWTFSRASSGYTFWILYMGCKFQSTIIISQEVWLAKWPIKLNFAWPFLEIDLPLIFIRGTTPVADTCITTKLTVEV